MNLWVGAFILELAACSNKTKICRVNGEHSHFSWTLEFVSEVHQARRESHWQRRTGHFSLWLYTKANYTGSFFSLFLLSKCLRELHLCDGCLRAYKRDAGDRNRCCLPLFSRDKQYRFCGICNIICDLNHFPNGKDWCMWAQLCLTLFDPMDWSPPGSSVHGISQTRILEWVAISSCRGSSQPGDQTHISCIKGRFFTTEPLAAAAKSLQSCPTLCHPIDSSPPGSPVPGILQARTLEWVAISFSNAWKWKVKVKSLSRIWLLATLWTAAYQTPPSMGFSRQEYWSGVPLPPLEPLGNSLNGKLYAKYRRWFRSWNWSIEKNNLPRAHPPV